MSFSAAVCAQESGILGGLAPVPGVSHCTSVHAKANARAVSPSDYRSFEVHPSNELRTIAEAISLQTSANQSRSGFLLMKAESNFSLLRKLPSFCT
eukprot:IDg17387t1